ncbi:hypothetical protein ACF0H5_016581 [Mactra antiquata]
MSHIVRAYTSLHHHILRLQPQYFTPTRLISKKTYPWPELKESEIEEYFIRGGGPGGQAVAKANNCVQIKHIPTGIVIRCHETRSGSENRRLAREKLIYKLDIYYNKENSFDALSKKELREKRNSADSKAKKKQALKKEFKQREGLNKIKESEGFQVLKDQFNGITINSKDQSFTSAEEYDTKLAVALPKWQESGVRGFWVKIAIQHTHLTTVFAKYGLDFHHAQPGYVMMSKWLPTCEPSMIPEYANQYLGVAGFVVNDKNQVLVIKERFHFSTATWKFPGGHADKGEDIFETAQREVREETGIETEFVGIVSFRHQTQYRYGCADFYFICLMKPINNQQTINACTQEIADCKWIDIDEYLEDPDVTDANRHFVQCYKDSLTNGEIIKSTLVNSYNKKTLHNIYSIQSTKETTSNTQ